MEDDGYCGATIKPRPDYFDVGKPKTVELPLNLNRNLVEALNETNRLLTIIETALNK